MPRAQPEPDPELLGRLDEVNLCLEWLERVRHNSTPNRGSYSLKHDVEHWAGQYVTNGAFIAAALFAGVPRKLDSPNATFALRKADIDALAATPRAGEG